jgi:hypothetical protein
MKKPAGTLSRIRPVCGGEDVRSSHGKFLSRILKLVAVPEVPPGNDPVARAMRFYPSRVQMANPGELF